MTPRTFGIYVHIPFCVRACPYCAHNKITRWDEEVLAHYVEALLREARIWAGSLAHRPVESLYIGGGTPSVLPLHLMEKLILGLRSLFPGLEATRGERKPEITVEMNPEHVTPERIQHLQGLGVERISLGVQSLIPEELRFLGRTHQPAHVFRAIEILHRVGIPERSVDLIFGFTGQTLQSWEATLRQVARLPLTHISTYELTLEPGTPFWIKARQGAVLLLPERTRLAMYLIKEQILEEAGFPRYEISNHAQPGHASRHNLLYWRRQDVLGLGSGATGQLGARRYINTFHVRKYVHSLLQGTSPPRYQETLSEDQILLERVFLGLRLSEGLPLPPDLLERAVQTWPAWVEVRGGRLILRFPEGVFHAETLAVEIATWWKT